MTSSGYPCDQKDSFRTKVCPLREVNEFEINPHRFIFLRLSCGINSKSGLSNQDSAPFTRGHDCNLARSTNPKTGLIDALLFSLPDSGASRISNLTSQPSYTSGR